METKWTLTVEYHLKMYCTYIWSINRGWEKKMGKWEEEIKKEDVGIQNKWGMREKYWLKETKAMYFP